MDIQLAPYDSFSIFKHSSGVLGSDRSKSERSHPPTISKRPAKLRYLRASGSSTSPAASDMSEALRAGPPPAPVRAGNSEARRRPEPVAVRYSGLRAPFSGLKWKKIDH